MRNVACSERESGQVVKIRGLLIGIRLGKDASLQKLQDYLDQGESELQFLLFLLGDQSRAYDGHGYITLWKEPQSVGEKLKVFLAVPRTSYQFPNAPFGTWEPIRLPDRLAQLIQDLIELG